MFYKVEVIPKILSLFDVNELIISGLSDECVTDTVLEYCKNNSYNCILIDSRHSHINDFINDYTLNVLPDYSNYGAIFLNDDPNWYTVFNELNIIKEKNDIFPLVFIGHNVFPYKRRDAYSNPDIIPVEFVNDYSEGFNINHMTILDGFFHANQENTPKNGVLTAVEDFLAQNPEIQLSEIRLLNGNIILYSKNSISKEKLIEFEEEIEEYSAEYDDYLDFQIEKNVLLNLSNNLNGVPDEYYEENNDEIIRNYEYKIKSYDNQIISKNIKINEINSKLDLKDTQIKHFKSKLINSENELINLNSEIVSLHQKLDETEQKFKDKQSYLNNNIVIANNQINSLKENIKQKENNFSVRESQLKNSLKDKNSELDAANIEINSLVESNEKLQVLMSEKDKDIASLKKEISSKNDEITDKNNRIVNLNKSILEKDDEIKSSLNSLKDQYNKNLYELDNNKYCISCFKEEISNNHLEIQYLKKDSLVRKFFSPISYLYLLLKSNPREFTLNLKLYKALKNSKCFDIGYYLNNNTDLLDSKWCKFFSPELHYVCNGFSENRKFNKKYFNRNSKKELLDYILNCP